MAFAPDFRFENFAADARSAAAFEAARAVARTLKPARNPLVLVAGAGGGKTHLLTAVGREAAARHPGLRAVFTDCEAFMNGLVESMRRGKRAEFAGRFAGADLLLFDGFHLCLGKERTQAELLAVLTRLRDAGRPIVLASDSPPDRMEGLNPGLQRLGLDGQAVIIPPLSDDTLVRIILAESERKGWDLDEAAVPGIAREAGGNARTALGLAARRAARPKRRT